MFHLLSPLRAWYSGKVPPDPQAIAQAEEADPNPVVLYEPGNPQSQKNDALGRHLYDLMDTLKRSPQEFRTWTLEDGMETFFAVLLDFGPPDLLSRVQILQRLGVFRFRKSDSQDEKRAKISAVFAAPKDPEDLSSALLFQARKLAAIWSPKPDTVLHYVLQQPAQVGRVLSDRLNPAGPNPVRIVGHPFDDVHSDLLRPLAETKTVAYERSGEIHIVLPVRETLSRWEQDSSAPEADPQVSLFDALLLHEVAELVLHETEPDLPALDAHLVAATFERYLRDRLLQVAVEDFFLNWPGLSQAEMLAQRESELAQQLQEIAAFTGENDRPQEDEQDIDDLPLDPAQISSGTKGSQGRVKVARSKDGKRKVVRKSTRVSRPGKP